MRLYHTDIARPKRASKLLSKLSELPLSQCQQLIAKGTGYRDWHDLECHSSKISVPLHRPGIAIQAQASSIAAVAELAGLSLGLVQIALTEARLFGSDSANLDQQLALRSAALRRSAIPYLGRRMRGEAGKVKSQGFGNSSVILKSFGRPTHILTHKSSSSIVADFEYVSPLKEGALPIPSRLYLAYGKWTEANGNIVLFSRDYMPLWRLKDGKRPEPLRPTQWIKKISQEHFWDDGKSNSNGQ